MAATTPSPLTSSSDKRNGAKLSRLLIDGGTTVLRNVFNTSHPPANLAADLIVQYKTLLSLSSRRILKKSQWDKLFPPSGAIPDSHSFDITLLFLLLTNICGLTPPSSGWHAKPSPSDTSLEANLVRIKFFRNELYGHVTSTGVDTPTFYALWQEVSAVLVSLGLNQAEIDRLQTERCGEDDYLDVLHDWADSEQDIKLQLKDLRQGQTETQQDIAKLLESQQEDHKTLQDTVFKLESVFQSQSKTRQAVEEVHETLQAGFHEVNQKVEHSKKRREMERAEELLRNLAKSEFKGDIECHVQRFQEGTREWIFKKVHNWLDDRSSPNRVMVISGSAGMGKSVISSVMCKRMQAAGRLLGSHFCKHNNVRYRKPQLMLQSLACHLSNALPEYKNALVDQLSRNLGPVELNSMGVEELFALLFKEPLGKVADPGRNMLMVIDGVDESEYQGRNELLDVIANQFCKLPQWIRFFVTTRPEINIADSLKHFQPIQLEDNHDENLRDIQLFFEMQLSQGIEQEDKDRLLSSLVRKSEGVFLYAHFLTDFVKTNVSLLTPEQLECNLPLGISYVYTSHFKRLENELCKELRIEEEQVLSFLCAVSASREPLPVAFISRLLDLSGRPMCVQRRLNKAIACISSLLPVRDDCLHFFHKSVKDWLTNTSIYGRHDFTVDEKEGHDILFELCRNELDKVKRKGLRDAQFNDTERYALHHGVQHMIEVGNSTEVTKTWHMEDFVHIYVTDLEVIYAKLCVNCSIPSEDISSVQRYLKTALYNDERNSLLTSLLKVLRKNSYLLGDHPHVWFQSVLNEGSPDLCSEAAAILENKFFSVSYMKYVDKEGQKGAVQARFYCSDAVACFDVSPEMDYMVCECRDGTIHLWSLETGNIEWIRPSLIKRKYEKASFFGSHDSDAVDGGAYRGISYNLLTYYRSVVFHPNGKNVLPGTLRSVYTIKGDCHDLFPKSNCTFSHCAFPRDKRTILTDCYADPKRVVLWSMENGEELKVIAGNEQISSFAISQDGSQIAFGDVTCAVYLVDVEKWRTECLFKCEHKNEPCGLMHFSLDNEALVCGYLHYSMEPYEGWVSDTEPSFTLSFTSSDEPPWLAESTDFFFWPIEPTRLTIEKLIFEGLLSSCVSRVFPSLQAGFYKKLKKETTLVGSPSFKHVVAVNVDLLNEVSFASTRHMVEEIVFSSEVDAIYSISLNETSWSNRHVQVTLFRMSTLEIVMERKFNSLSLSLVPVKEGVVLCLRDQVPKLWDFELNKCIRPLDRVTGTDRLTRISDEVLACQMLCRRLTLDEMRSDLLIELNDSLHLLEEQDSSKLTTEDSVELDDSTDFDGAFNVDDSLEFNNSSDSEVSVDDSHVFAPINYYLYSSTFELYRMLDVDIINVTSGECISSVKTTICPEKTEVVFVLRNRQNQLLVCTIKTLISNQYCDEEELTVSLRNSNVLKCVWQRSAKRYTEELLLRPGFILSAEEELIVTWHTFDLCYGIHILDAKTGETCNTMLKEHKDIIDCKFTGNCDTLVCCSEDNFLRLLNVKTGHLLSVLDVEERPCCLGACLDKPLVAIGLPGARLKFIHVELPKVKETEEQKGSSAKR